jgi:enamine deaminase RidA (YjgF/YER057c/UK114 family)
MKWNAETPRTEKGAAVMETERGHSCLVFPDQPRPRRPGTFTLPALGLYELAKNGGLTRRSFLCMSLFAASFLSSCKTSRRTNAAQSSGARPEARVTELKLELPPPTRPSATLRPAVTTGNLIFVSGHISRAADGRLIAGRVGEELDLVAGQAAARQCGLAILSTLRNELGSLDRVKRVVKVLGMVNCPPGFRDQPAVINRCSELFLDVFGKENGLGARSAVGMSSLPSGVAVEIEAIFEIE